jgi:hypothetical protein
MSRTLLALALLLLAGVPAALTAQRATPPDPPARPESFEALMRCRAIADAAARLLCFDSAAANLDAAAARRDVVIVDRAQVREGRRRLFGLALPRIPIFGGGDDDHDADQVQTVEGVIAGAAEGGGRWTISLQDGAMWVQTDYNQLAFRPRPGQHVVINRGALGSFMMRINNQPGIRVQRVR